MAVNTVSVSSVASRRVAALAGVLFLVSLVLPAIRFVGGSPPTLFGYAVVLNGWLGPLDLIFAWYANPLFVTAVVLLLRGKAPRLAAWLGIGAVLIAASAWFVTGINNSSHVDQVAALGAGAYVWQLAHVLVAVSGILALRAVPRPSVARSAA